MAGQLAAWNHPATQHTTCVGRSLSKLHTHDFKQADGVLLILELKRSNYTSGGKNKKQEAVSLSVDDSSKTKLVVIENRNRSRVSTSHRA